MHKAKFTMETTFLVKRSDLVLANNVDSLIFVCKSIIFTSLDRWFEIEARRLAYFERETKNIIGHFLD